MTAGIFQDGLTSYRRFGEADTACNNDGEDLIAYGGAKLFFTTLLPSDRKPGILKLRLGKRAMEALRGYAASMGSLRGRR